MNQLETQTQIVSAAFQSPSVLVGGHEIPCGDRITKLAESILELVAFKYEADANRDIWYGQDTEMRGCTESAVDLIRQFLRGEA